MRFPKVMLRKHVAQQNVPSVVYSNENRCKFALYFSKFIANIRFNQGDYIMSLQFPLKTTLPEGLSNDEALIKQSVIELSKLIAWIWYGDSYLVFEDDPREIELKNFIIEIFNTQSMYAGACISYGNEQAEDVVNRLSKCIDYLFTSEKIQNDDDEKEGYVNIAPVEAKIPTLTLNELFTKINGKGFTLSSKKGKELVNKCYFIVDTTTFIGSYEDIQDKRCLPKAFISYIAFPPCYPLNDTTKYQLNKWVKEDTTKGVYIPPVFLPLGACS
ncbi:hypothetical protein ACP6PL_15430 [Dapis sp. BLCC M126]|uniref:hypothetical protein n=1 Tax=Dapis sp. BLCC M126 TaxID=3400189 RepID=UPI003CECDCA1